MAGTLVLGANALIKVTPGLMIWTIVCFLIALFVLKRYAFGPIQKAIDDRRERIRLSLDEADNAREEARNLLEQHRALIASARSDAEGIRWNGPVRYFRSWIPEVPKALLPLIIPLEILGQFMRLISLSVRLFANMLAGHMLILTFIGLMFVLENVFLAVVVVPAATAFYLFEVVIVVSIQAFIFAALSAIYIGSAIEPEH